MTRKGLSTAHLGVHALFNLVIFGIEGVDCRDGSKKWQRGTYWTAARERRRPRRHEPWRARWEVAEENLGRIELKFGGRGRWHNAGDPSKPYCWQGLQ